MRRHGNAPCRSKDSWVTARLVSLTNYRRMKWTQGLELHQPGAAYETGPSTGSPCNTKMVDEDGNAPSLAGCEPAVQTSTLQALVGNGSRPWNVGTGSLPGPNIPAGRSCVPWNVVGDPLRRVPTLHDDWRGGWLSATAALWNGRRSSLETDELLRPFMRDV